MRPNDHQGPVSAEALFAVDSNQRIVAWNGEAARLFGHDLASALGAHCYEVVGACDRRGHQFCKAGCPVIRAADGGTAPPTLRLQVPTDRGDQVPVDVSTIVLYSGDRVGPVIHLCRPSVRQATAPAAPDENVRLTAREKQVLDRLCHGETNEVMARDLGISETTVRNHVQHILEKLAAHSRAEVVALAYKDGLLA